MTLPKKSTLGLCLTASIRSSRPRFPRSMRVECKNRCGTPCKITSNSKSVTSIGFHLPVSRIRNRMPCMWSGDSSFVIVLIGVLSR